MNTKFVTFFAIFAILFGCVLCAGEAESDTIKLSVFGSSSKWWIAVNPSNERYETVDVEVREAGSLNWVHTTSDPLWGYFQLPSESGTGFKLPLSFRFTAANGQSVVATDFMNGISAGNIVDTKVQYPVVAATAPTAAATASPTNAPTVAATAAPTRAPTAAATSAPASTPTRVPTTPINVPSKAPTSAPKQLGSAVPATVAPTQAPTAAPTSKPTVAPIQAATQKPLQAVNLCQVTTPSAEAVKIMVPLYVYPGAAWDQLIASAQSGVKIIAVINPNSGPNPNGPDASYTTYIKKLINAGIEVVGYVHTSWGARDINTVTSEINTYATKYTGVNGIFFDEGATEKAQIPYYRQAYNYVLSKNMVHTILNPGVQPDQGYLDVSTNIVIYENYATSLASTRFDSWVTCAPNAAAKAGYKYKFSAIIHTASLSDMPSLITKANNLGMGLVYVTDGLGGCCTYNSLTSYFPQMGSSVKSFNA